MEDKQWNSIVGQVVEFTVAYKGKIVMGPVWRLGKHDPVLSGFFIAGDKKQDVLMINAIKSYRLIEVKDYPLLLGYKYTSDRLSQLLKGEG